MIKTKWSDIVLLKDHLWRWTILTGKFLSRPKRPIYFSTEISESFVIMESTPILFLMPERGSLSGGAYLHTVGYYKECPCRFI